MLTIHHSNRLDTLADALADVTREPLASAFTSEVVVVESRGIARWLSLRLAERAGVCANVHFPFPGAFAWQLYRAAAGDLPEQSPFEPAVLAWRILAVLAELEDTAELEPVKRYVRGDPLRRFELATRLAGLFDEYLVYRPDWIAKWEREQPRDWQGVLWRRVSDAAGSPHRASLHTKLLKALVASKAPSIALPERVSVFGAPALPPQMLELFSALARHADVHLFVQNPCRQYWGDIAAEGDIARRVLARQPEAAYLDVGNSLLASLGKQGRDFFDLVSGIESDTVEQIDAFAEPGDETLLASIQSDILDLRERAPDSPQLANDDRSLQVHSCHSAMREVEVLHDQLLALFSRWPDLEAADVVVMTPDIERYAPYVEAVFGTAEPRIPFSISDRSAERASTLAATFMALLELPGSRYDASSVLAILDEPAVQRRYDLRETDLEAARRWVREAHIRWGIDAAHRASFGLPATHEHTWRFGLDRLLLGYALPGGDERLFSGVLPYDEVEGSLGGVLGRFQSFAEDAIALDTRFAGFKPVAAWCELLHGVLTRFFDAGEERAEELEAIRSCVAAIDMEARAGGHRDAVPLAVIVTALRARLEVPGRAFLSGGVTFCAMVPMRSLPFEIVCMIGMNDGAFPRTRRRDGFDLMAKDFRKGDRSRRDDDRYLFLESILSAGRCLYMSYTGRHIREDTVIPPSVLVSELIDYAARAPDSSQIAANRDRIVTVHPLQAFSRRYFTNGRLFTYSATRARAAALAGRGQRMASPLVTTELAPPEEARHTIDLEELIRFFRNPARHFLRERLGIRLEEAEDEIEPREPFTLDTLEGYGLKQQLLERRLGGDARDALAIAHAAGLLPHGLMGDALFQREDDAIQVFARKVEPHLGHARLEPVTLGTDCGDLRLVGTLRGVTAAGILLYRAAKLTVNDRIGAWIRHLALNAARPKGAERRTRVIAQDRTLDFAPVDAARDRLRELLELYCEGLRRPLHFFPRTACEYADKDWTLAPDQLERSWAGNERDLDAYYRLAFRAGNPLDEEFEKTSRIVFTPLMDALEQAEPA